MKNLRIFENSKNFHESKQKENYESLRNVQKNLNSLDQIIANSNDRQLEIQKNHDKIIHLLSRVLYFYIKIYREFNKINEIQRQIEIISHSPKQMENLENSKENLKSLKQEYDEIFIKKQKNLQIVEKILFRTLFEDNPYEILKYKEEFTYATTQISNEDIKLEEIKRKIKTIS